MHHRTGNYLFPLVFESPTPLLNDPNYIRLIFFLWTLSGGDNNSVIVLKLWSFYGAKLLCESCQEMRERLLKESLWE